EAALAALAARIGDALPALCATAIAGLARRGSVGAARSAIEAALGGRDWRVGVAAVRALAAADEAGRALVARSLERRWSALVRGDGAEAQVSAEALRALVGKPLADRAALDAIASLGTKAAAATHVPAIARGWIDCLARLVAPSVANA